MKSKSTLFFVLLLFMTLSFVPGISAKAAPVKDYSLVFDANYYSLHNPDVAAAFNNNSQKLLDHFLNHGIAELRQGNAKFDVLSYKRAYPDLRKAFGNDIMAYYNHYIDFGYKEGRNKTVSVNTIENPTSVYHGIDLSSVYDYSYYLGRYPELYKLFSADDEAAISHFMRFGIKNGLSAKENPDKELLEKLRPISIGLSNEISSYQGIDLSEVYNYAYYMFTNPDVARAVNYDSARACDHFVNYGMNEDRKGLPVYDMATYENIRSLIKAPADIIRQIGQKANEYASSTPFIIVTDKTNMRVAVFQGGKGNYSLLKEFPCAIGANVSPTPSGVYRLGARGLYFNTGTAGRCWYYTQIQGNYLFHSQIYDRSNEPVNLIDDSMAIAVSHGCIRLNIENAKWMFDTLPSGTTIVIY